MAHAAWHSCGSYQVNVGQIEAYKSLGARVISVALMDALSPPPPGGRWAAYLAASRDFPRRSPLFRLPRRSRALWTSALLKDGWWPLIHGDQARWLIALAERGAAPRGASEAERIDLIHANHYFTLPLARLLRGVDRARRSSSDTQDIQARQYVLRNQGGFFLKPLWASYDDMLAVELAWTGERRSVRPSSTPRSTAPFRSCCRTSRHALVYPAVAPVPPSAGGRGHHHRRERQLRQFRQPALVPERGAAAGWRRAAVDLRQYRRGREKPRQAAVRGASGAVQGPGRRSRRGLRVAAGCVLLPTVEGHGLSIKAVEALSCGAPLIAHARWRFAAWGSIRANLAM